jgi:hypothetical protein
MLSVETLSGPLSMDAESFALIHNSDMALGGLRDVIQPGLLDALCWEFDWYMCWQLDNANIGSTSARHLCSVELAHELMYFRGIVVVNKLGNDDDKLAIFVLSLPFLFADVCEGRPAYDPRLLLGLAQCTVRKLKPGAKAQWSKVQFVPLLQYIPQGAF